MIFLIVFFCIVIGAWLMPLLLRLIFIRKIELVKWKRKYKVYLIDSKFIYFIGIALGLFNTKSIFINVRFSKLLNQIQKEMLIDHEIAHIKLAHLEYKILLVALKFGLFAELLTFFSFEILTYVAIIWLVYQFLHHIFYTLQKGVFHKFEFRADRYAYLENKCPATILEWYRIMGNKRESITHPSLDSRMNNIINTFKDEKIDRINTTN